ncbi:hypothetical protein ACXYMO_14720 [Arenibacterium sp. CAU 1754]
MPDTDLTLNETDIFTQLEFMTWRDKQLEVISQQIESNFPKLISRIDEQIDNAGTMNLAWSQVQLGKKISELCAEWSKEQAEEALQKTESALDELWKMLEPEFSIDPGLMGRFVSVAPALASVGLAATSIAAVPTVISIATVTTGGFLAFFWAAPYISWPLFALGAAGLGVTAFLSGKLFDRAIESWREALRRRAYKRAEEAVFGLGAPPSQRTILDDIQALAIQATANSMEDRA